MSKMIPPFYDESIASNGEKKLFRNLQRLGDGYVILHSLGIARHQEKVFGEIDFVILCQQGILCLEVKGGYVYRKEGVWHFTDRNGREGRKAEGPFRQVFTAMLSLRKHLKKHFGTSDPVATCQFACGVVFPDMPFTQKGPDIVSETIFDSRGSMEDFDKYITFVFTYWANILEEKHGFFGGKLTGAQISRAENYLRGDFGFVPSLGYIVEKTEERLLALTREQTLRLSMAGDNPRILMKGGAGTGKTLLGLEHARRCALSGKKVLYLCYNRNLCTYLRLIIKKGNPELVDSLEIDTLHGYICDLLERNSSMPSTIGLSSDEFFSRIVPESFLEMVEKKGLSIQYDTLVVDEGQDLLGLEYILCIDHLIKGGLKAGNWHVCYDSNQNLYNSKLDDGLELIKGYYPTLLTLDTNCRNTRPVGIYNTLFTGMTPARFFRVDGESVVKEVYSDFEDEKSKLVRVVKKMIGQGIRPGSICLLSKFRYENSCLKGENIFKSICRFQNITDLDPRNIVDDSIKFCTIHSFKGLEAPVVFLLDVERFNDPASRMLNYTAMSRATSLLYVFYNGSAEGELQELISTSAELLKIIEN